MSKNYPIHEAAEMFPMMDRDDLAALADDIRRHGQQNAVELHEGRIIDGRNRAKACRMAGVEVNTTDVTHLAKSQDLSPHDYVLSANLHRRHLTPSQRAMVGQKYKEHEAAQAKDRMKQGGGDKRSDEARSGVENVPHREEQGRARDKAGEKVDVSGKMIDLAERIRRDAVAELADAVQRGEIALNAAKLIATLPHCEQVTTIPQGPDAIKQKASELRKAKKQASQADVEDTSDLDASVAPPADSADEPSPSPTETDTPLTPISPEPFDLDRESERLREAILEHLKHWPIQRASDARRILSSLVNATDDEWSRWLRNP